jgi:hypothetical protein
MRKILAISLMVILITTIIGCNKNSEVTEGIKFIKDNEIEYNIYSPIKIAYSLDEFIQESDALLKFRVIDKSYFTYQWTDTEFNYTRDIPATVYTIRVISDLGNTNIKPNTELSIYTEHSPITYWEDDINLQVNAEYISFLGLLPDRMPEGLKAYIDYFIMDGELGIFPKINENDYLINNYTKQFTPFENRAYKSGKEKEQDPTKFGNYTILPQNEVNWSVVSLNELEDFLVEKMNKE